MAQELTETCLAWVVLGGLDVVGIVVYAHSAEFKAVERAAEIAGAFLFKEYRTGRRALYGDSHRYENNGRYNEKGR